MPQEIPIEFDYQGKHYKGFFSEVTGCGTYAGGTWHFCLYAKGGFSYNGQMNYN